MALNYPARYVAIDDAILSYDGIACFWTDSINSKNDNFYFYEDIVELLTLIPWDFESSSWINPNHAPPHWKAPLVRHNVRK